MLIDQHFCRKHKACYTDEKLHELFDRPMTIEEVLTRNDGPWEDIPFKDRRWVFLRAATRQQVLNWLASIVEKALSCVRKPHKSLTVVVEALKKDSVTTENCHAVCAVRQQLNIRNVYGSYVYAANAAGQAAYATFNIYNRSVFASDEAESAGVTDEQQIEIALEILNHVD